MMCKKFFYFVFFKKCDFDPDPEMDPEPDPEPNPEPDPEPDPELSEKSDPDPEIIFSAPTHWMQDRKMIWFGT